MRSKWPFRGFEPQFFSFLKKKYDFNEKKQWKKQDLNQQSSSLNSSAIPTELSSLVTESYNISLNLLMTIAT